MTNREEDFLAKYLRYTSKTESPTFFHRWSGITCLAAWIGRSVHLPFGHQNIHANMYVMLVGLAGTKKSTAIKIGAKLLKEAGYTKFAARKTRQEKFLLDMSEGTHTPTDASSFLDMDLGIDIDSSSAPCEVFAAADEVNNFIGCGNLEFMSILGELWDFEGDYDHKTKASKSVTIANPTVSILAGNTFIGFNRLFPPEAQEQGFFSRNIFVYAEPIGRKYVIPPIPDQELRDELIEHLHKMKTIKGKLVLNRSGYETLDAIYHSWEGMRDPRFDAYDNRRSIHLLKLAMVITVARLSKVVEKEDIIYANTILTFTESYMPKALGEFGKSRNSSIAQKVMQVIDSSETGVSFKDIWKTVLSDIDNRNQLIEIITNLQMADRIQQVKGSNTYLPVKKMAKEGMLGTLDWTYLLPEERGL